MRFYPLQFRLHLYSLLSTKFANQLSSLKDCLPSINEQRLHDDVFPYADACDCFEEYIPTLNAFFPRCCLLKRALLFVAPSAMDLLYPVITHEDNIGVLLIQSCIVRKFNYGCQDTGDNIVQPIMKQRSISLKFGLCIEWLSNSLSYSSPSLMNDIEKDARNRSTPDNSSDTRVMESRADMSDKVSDDCLRNSILNIQDFACREVFPDTSERVFLFTKSNEQRDRWVSLLMQHCVEAPVHSSSTLSNRQGFVGWSGLTELEKKTVNEYKNTIDDIDLNEVKKMPKNVQKTEDTKRQSDREIQLETELKSCQQKCRVSRYELIKLRSQLKCNQFAGNCKNDTLSIPTMTKNTRTLEGREYGLHSTQRNQSDDPNMTQCIDATEHENLCEEILNLQEMIDSLEQAVQVAGGTGNANLTTHDIPTGNDVTYYNISLHSSIEKAARLSDIISSLASVFPSRIAAKIKELLDDINYPNPSPQHRISSQPQTSPQHPTSPKHHTSPQHPTSPKHLTSPKHHTSPQHPTSP